MVFRLSSQQKLQFCAYAPELGSQFLQQTGKFRVSDQMTNPAEPAKMLLHEEDLKVRELSLSSAAKYSESGALGNMFQRLVGPTAAGLVTLASSSSTRRSTSLCCRASSLTYSISFLSCASVMVSPQNSACHHGSRETAEDLILNVKLSLSSLSSYKTDAFALTR
jgi:hypothetical protein